MTKHLKAHEVEAVTRFAELHGRDVPRYGVLDLPPYAEMAAGRWSLTQDPKSRVVRGYFTGLQAMDGNWVLRKRARGRDTIWMSITPMERESLAIQHHYAKGRVVIMGLGIGLLLWNVSRKPEVTQIVVVEEDPHIIDMFQRVSAFWDWPEREKILIVEANALTWRPEYLAQVDTLLIDIWPLVGDSRLLDETQRIQRNVGATAVGSWGQELEVTTWASARKLPLPLTHEDVREFVADTGVPWIGCDDADYGATCIQAALQTVLTIR